MILYMKYFLLYASTISTRLLLKDRDPNIQNRMFIHLHLLYLPYRVNHILIDYFTLEWGFKSWHGGRKERKMCLQKKNGRVARTVKTSARFQAVSCFSSWILGTPTTWSLILTFSPLLSCLQSHSLSSCSSSVPRLCSLTAGTGLLNVSVDLYIHSSPRMTPFSHRLSFTWPSLPHILHPFLCLVSIPCALIGMLSHHG